ncbi:hypothetical protein UFOVP75_30 [uncultured Caudovirales phage]|uniref:Uncharacterized protein n=1 Tax=uncultured Caudovirales phage TaxID=2100421 RepID=A0A6J5KW59_9CAUD|nr:hypothetical protein UFOVP75_30 [uncultured Caudovirales phage]
MNKKRFKITWCEGRAWNWFDKVSDAREYAQGLRSVGFENVTLTYPD